MNNLFANSKVEGVVSPEDLVQPELIQIIGNTDQTILYEFKTNTSAPATLGNTTRVAFCKSLPIEKPMEVISSEFLIYEESCFDEILVTKVIGDGIEKTDNEDGKTIALKVILTPENTKDLPDEIAFAFRVETVEFGKKVYSFGSLLIRHIPLADRN